MMFMLYTEYGNHFGRNVIKTGIIPVDLGNHFSDLFDLRKTCDKEDFMEFDQKM